MARPEQDQNSSVPAPFREVGMTYRQMDFWVRRGYLHPIHEGGQGHRRKWPQAEVEIGCRMALLVRGGYTPAAAARLARHGIESAQQEVRTA